MSGFDICEKLGAELSARQFQRQAFLSPINMSDPSISRMESSTLTVSLAFSDAPARRASAATVCPTTAHVILGHHGSSVLANRSEDRSRPNPFSRASIAPGGAGGTP